MEYHPQALDARDFFSFFSFFRAAPDIWQTAVYIASSRVELFWVLPRGCSLGWARDLWPEYATAHIVT